jgi:purine catabolism regulator
VLTVKSLLSELDLELAAGAEAAATPVRWIHISELADPTPWLSGGELLLTTGIQLGTAAAQREFVHRLADHGLAGLGLGTGFDHKKLPRALVAEAEKSDFPLFEVPYEVPFIAITEKAFTRLVNEQYDVLQSGIAIHKRLERLVLEGRGLAEITKTLAGAIGGAVLVLDPRGEVRASHTSRRPLPDDALSSLRSELRERAERSTNGAPGPFVPGHAELSDRSLALPVPAPGKGAPQAWLVAARDSGGLADFERLIVQQAVIVVALELMRERIVHETERRLAGDVLAEALGGGLEPGDLRGRLRPFGIGDEAAVLLFELDDPAAGESTLERVLAEGGFSALVAAPAAPRRPLLCVVIDSAGVDPLEVAGMARENLAADHGPVRASASRPAPTESVRRSFHEARCALEATALVNGKAPEVASWRDLGAFTLLLSLQDDEALRVYCDNLLSPIEQSEGGYGAELLRSLEAFIEQNGQWERAAREVFCHRHTLRYRIKRIEELTGRDLSRAHDRIEFWLALRARELVR